MRDAVLGQDAEYQEALDRVQKTICVIELLRGKMKGFEMAYTSVKKIIGENPRGMLNRGPGSGVGTAPVGGSNPDPMRPSRPQSTPGFGVPRYNDRDD